MVAHGIEPSWSPTDEWIAFLARDDTNRRGYELRLIHPDGSGERVLFRNKVPSTYSRGWGPMFEWNFWSTRVVTERPRARFHTIV